MHWDPYLREASAITWGRAIAAELKLTLSAIPAHLLEKDGAQMWPEVDPNDYTLTGQFFGRRIVKNAIRYCGVFFCAVSLMSLQACATKIKASSTQNPPPKEAFSAFGKIELKTVVFKTGIIGDSSGLAKIGQNLNKNLISSMVIWNQKPDNGRVLVIEPVIEEMSFKHGASRVLLGPMVGSSGVLMRLNIHDAAGQQIAFPEFFQHAGAWSGGLTLGIHDNLMLMRVAELASNYIEANYSRAVGGAYRCRSQGSPLSY